MQVRMPSFSFRMKAASVELTKKSSRNGSNIVCVCHKESRGRRSALRRKTMPSGHRTTYRTHGGHGGDVGEDNILDLSRRVEDASESTTSHRSFGGRGHVEVKRSRSNDHLPQERT
jgi:hypothetical protein